MAAAMAAGAARPAILRYVEREFRHVEQVERLGVIAENQGRVREVRKAMVAANRGLAIDTPRHALRRDGGEGLRLVAGAATRPFPRRPLFRPRFGGCSGFFDGGRCDFAELVISRASIRANRSSSAAMRASRSASMARASVSSVSSWTMRGSSCAFVATRTLDYAEIILRDFELLEHSG